jgi:hypothetical protein
MAYSKICGLALRCATLLPALLLVCVATATAIGPQKGDEGYKTPLTQEQVQDFNAQRQQREKQPVPKSVPAPETNTLGEEDRKDAPAPSMNKNVQYGEILIHPEK